MKIARNENQLAQSTPQVEGFGYLDLSAELRYPGGFKSLSWWREEGGLIHGFLTVGVVAEQLRNGYGSPSEQFADVLPWLNLKSVANGVIRPLDVFADNSLDYCIWVDFAGVYLGKIQPKSGDGSESAVRQLLHEIAPELRAKLDDDLWKLWEQKPYAYSLETDPEDRCIKSAHQFTFRDEQMILTTKSVILL